MFNNELAKFLETQQLDLTKDQNLSFDTTENGDPTIPQANGLKAFSNSPLTTLLPISPQQSGIYPSPSCRSKTLPMCSSSNEFCGASLLNIKVTKVCRKKKKNKKTFHPSDRNQNTNQTNS